MIPLEFSGQYTVNYGSTEMVPVFKSITKTIGQLMAVSQGLIS